MNFQLTPQQEEFVSNIRAFARKEIAPKAAEVDRTGIFPMDTIRKMAKEGYMGIPVPRDMGGLGWDTVTYLASVEEIARCCSSNAVILTVHTSVGTMPILNFGTDEQIKRWVPSLARGEKIGAFALTEAGAGSDASAVATRAVSDGDGWILNGTKIFITNGGECNLAVVVASTEPEKKHRGLTAFVVDREMDGFKVGAREKTMGMKGSITSELIFEDVKVGPEHVLGGLGNGFRVSMETLDGSRMGIGAQSVGMAQTALDELVSWARSATVNGKPAIRAQNVQFLIAEMETRIEAARNLVLTAAATKDAGRPIAGISASSKLFSSEIAMWAALAATRMMGREAILRGTAIERIYRDAKVTQIYEGTSEIQKMVISRDVLAR